MSDTQNDLSRRELFRRVGRLAAGGTLAGLAGVLGARAHRRGECLLGRSAPCSACSIQPTCTLSALREAKR